MSSLNEFLEWETAISPYVINSVKVDKTYEIHEKLGKGSFGIVVLATKKTIGSHDNSKEEEKVRRDEGKDKAPTKKA